MENLGINLQDADALRKIERTLHRWSELECGDSNNWCSFGIERDEQTDKPYMVTYPHNGKSSRRPVADRERGALRRAKVIMDNYPDLWFFHQSDPRGCAVYIGRKSDLTDEQQKQLDAYYTRGVAACID